MIEWWQIVLVIAASIGAISEIVIRLLPHLKRKNEEKQDSKAEIRAHLEIAEAYIQDYAWGGIGELEKAIRGAPIPTRVLNQLKILSNLMLVYFRTRDEAIKVIKAEVQARHKQLAPLNDAFSKTTGSTAESMFSDNSNFTIDQVFKAILKKELTFPLVRELILEGRWDAKYFIDGSDGVQEILFKDIIDGSEFHKFIDSLIKLQGRLSIRNLREVQANLLRQVQTTLKEHFDAHS